jgi:hypothetical protein
VDFDGKAQVGADQTTRGFRKTDGTTIFVDVF